MPPETRREQVAGALACMLGGLILARGMKESEGLEFLKDCRSFLRRALANSDAEGLLGRRAPVGRRADAPDSAPVPPVTASGQQGRHSCASAEQRIGQALHTGLRNGVQPTAVFVSLLQAGPDVACFIEILTFSDDLIYTGGRPADWGPEMNLPG
jgi:hypothetical protein